MEKKKRACCVPVCKGERFDLVHKLPMNTERAEIWIESLDVPELKKHSVESLRKRIFVCCRHFRKQDYKNAESRCLNKTAVPSINLKDLENENVIDPKVLIRDLPPPEEELLVVSSNIPTVQRSRVKSDTVSRITQKTIPKKRNEEIIAEVHDLTETPVIPSYSKKKKTDSQTSYSSNSTNYIYILAKSTEKPKVLQEVTEEPKNDCLEVYINMADFIEEQHLIESPELTMTSDHISVPSRNLKLNNFWLRDHCRCSECYNHGTRQRRYSILHLDPNVRTNNCQFTDDELIVSWNDGHESQYSWDFLESNSFDLRPRQCEKIIWDAETIASSDFAKVSLGDLMSDDDVARSVVESLVKYGVAFVNKVPPNLSCTELAIKRLFPIQKTFFGEMWSFQSGVMKESDTAYTHEALGAHTDNTYFSDPAGLQVLHCTEFEGDGGESLLVDGFKVAQEIKSKYPEVYKRLCTTVIPFEYIDETHHHSYQAPLIKEDKINQCVEQIRFNLYDRSPMNTISVDKIPQFYDDLRTMATEVASESNEWWFKLTPGTVVIFDNWRLLHGRAELTGKRVMCGCYVSRTDFMSVARKMNFIQ
ncbi:gamma-butyrobetaine dioxygenase [Sergentomyia squamirostris]